MQIGLYDNLALGVSLALLQCWCLPSGLAHPDLDTRINSVHHQSKAWLALQCTNQIVLVCPRSETRTWAVWECGWTVYERDANKGFYPNTNLTPSFRLPEPVLTNRDGWQVLDLDTVWRELPRCGAVLFGDKDRLYMIGRDRRSSSLLRTELSQGRFTVLGQESDYDQLFSLLEKQNNGARVEEVVEWKREGPTIRVGRSFREWAGVDVPSNVYQYVTAVLGNEQAPEWDVGNHVNYGPQGKHVVFLGDLNVNRSFVFLVLPDKWVLLNHPKALPNINLVMDGYFKSPDELKAVTKVIDYVEDVAHLFKGRGRVGLSEGFWKEYDVVFATSTDKPYWAIEGWLRRKEKNPDALRALCRDPIVKIEGDGIEIQCNVITSSGSVEKWVLIGKFAAKKITLTEISITKIREERTFSFPIAG